MRSRPGRSRQGAAQSGEYDGTQMRDGTLTATHERDRIACKGSALTRRLLQAHQGQLGNTPAMYTRVGLKPSVMTSRLRMDRPKRGSDLEIE